MPTFTQSHSRWLDPPDDPPVCESEHGCGESLERDNLTDEWVCKNIYCPEKFDGRAQEMAELLIGAREEVKSLAAKVKRLEMKPSNHNHVFIGGKCAHCGIGVSEIKTA